MQQEGAYRDFAVLTPQAKSFLEKVRNTDFTEMTPQQLDKWSGEIHAMTARDPILRNEMRQLLGSTPTIHPSEGRWVPDPDEDHRDDIERQYGRADIRRGLMDLQFRQRRRQMEMRQPQLQHDVLVANWIRSGVRPDIAQRRAEIQREREEFVRRGMERHLAEARGWGVDPLDPEELRRQLEIEFDINRRYQHHADLEARLPRNLAVADWIRTGRPPPEVAQERRRDAEEERYWRIVRRMQEEQGGPLSKAQKRFARQQAKRG
jgi:hypothetical protein